MNKILEIFIISLNFIRCIPHIIVFYTHKNRSIIRSDVQYWLYLKDKKYKQILGFIYLLSCYPQFRNLLYYRLKKGIYFLNLLCPKMPTLIISTGHIGEKFFIANGFATAIGAEYIGNHCHIYQQVTIGYSKFGGPTILDNVIIRPGAIIIGKITIGNNVVIGAGATVFRDVPDNCTVYPPSSKIIKWDNETPITDFLQEPRK
jgi:serine O-acetyltransferase